MLIKQSKTKQTCLFYYRDSNGRLNPKRCLLWLKAYYFIKKLKKLQRIFSFRPRRIVSAFPFNHEFELCEARLRMQAPIVSAFIIQESAYSNAGRPRLLLLRERLSRGSTLAVSTVQMALASVSIFIMPEYKLYFNFFPRKC
jgi:hypothetical protein